MIIQKDYENYFNSIKNYKNIIKIKKEFFNFIPMGFDIETTTQYTKDYLTDKVITHYSNMYIWQLSILDDVLIGRTWDSFNDVINLLINTFCKYGTKKLLIFIHNQSFEFQFMGRELEERNHTIEVFAREKRHPMKFTVDNSIVFLDSYQLTHYSLERLAKCYTTTQKQVNELDYSLLRNSKTKLTKKELNYTICDVVILKEFAEYYYNTYLKYGKMPMTLTMIANDVVKEKIKELKCQQQVFYLMRECYPKSKSQYKYIMSFYSGAYTHGMLRNLFETHTNGLAYDVTSEYPYAFMNFYYPMGKFKKLNNTKKKIVESYLEKYCCLCEVYLTNIKTKTGVTILSKNHLEECKNPIYDNGRLFSADKVKAKLTEVDIKTLQLHYDFKIKYISVIYAKRGNLPNYFLLAIAELYNEKSVLKGVEGKEVEYAVSKEKLNGQYGSACTRLVFENIYFDNGWQTEEKEIDFNKIFMNKNKLPQWAVYCTSWSRFLILSTIAKIKPCDYWYSDTDSIKCKNKKYIRDMFEETNEQIIENNKLWIERLNLKELYPQTNFETMGTFDREDDLIKFKCLGSKRYLTETKKGIHCTVAGLPRGQFEKYCEKNNLDYFEEFKEYILFSCDNSNKLCAYYEDKEQFFTVTDYQGNTTQEHTYSYVSLIPTTFKLTIKDELIKLKSSKYKGVE